MLFKHGIFIKNSAEKGNIPNMHFKVHNLWQLLHIQGPNTTNMPVYQEETHLPWTWVPTTSIRDARACATKQIQACLQPSKAAELPTPSLKTNWGRSTRSVWGDSSGVFTEPHSSIKLTRKHCGRDTHLQNESQGEPAWFEPHSYSHASSDLGAVLGAIHTGITVLYHWYCQSARSSRWAHHTAHPTQLSHRHTPTPGSDIPWEPAMAGSGSSLFQRHSPTGPFPPEEARDTHQALPFPSEYPWSSSHCSVWIVCILSRPLSAHSSPHPWAGPAQPGNHTSTWRNRTVPILPSPQASQ